MKPPQGWKWSIVGKERYIVSPEGEMFKSIEKALAQMVKFRLPEDQVQIFLKPLLILIENCSGGGDKGMFGAAGRLAKVVFISSKIPILTSSVFSRSNCVLRTYVSIVIIIIIIITVIIKEI